MKDIWTQPLRKQIGFAALASLLVHGAVVLIHWYVVSPIGYGGTFFMQLYIFFVIPFLGVVVILPFSLFLLPFRKTRRQAITIQACAPVYIAIGLVLVPLAFPVRMNGFHRLAERSEPLVNAVHGFTEKEGRPPVDLQELVPRYLPEIPGTGMPAYPEYEYSTESDQWDGNPWVLYVHCTSGGFNFDMFMYLPLQNYPEKGYGGYLERIGTWAYVHE